MWATILILGIGISLIIIFLPISTCEQCGNTFSKRIAYFDPDGKICNDCWNKNVN